MKVDLSDIGGKDRIILSTDRAKASAVEFHIKNSSDEMLHEFLISPWKGSINDLSYTDDKGQVIESKRSQLARGEDIKPCAEAILRLPLKPGHYVVFCDQPGHYKLGMVARFTVMH